MIKHTHAPDEQDNTKFKNNQVSLRTCERVRNASGHFSACEMATVELATPSAPFKYIVHGVYVMYFVLLLVVC